MDPDSTLARLLAESFLEDRNVFEDDPFFDEARTRREHEKRLVAQQNRRAAKDGDVVFGPGGVVRRVGDQPRSRRNTPSTEVVRPMSTIEQKQDQLRKALMEFAGIQALLDRFNGQQPPPGSVIRWIKKYDNRTMEMVLDADTAASGRDLRFKVSSPQEYIFLAFRSPGEDNAWYTTSQRGTNKYTWDKLIEEIADSHCEIADTWLEVPAPAKVEEAAMDPSAWARQMFGKKPEATDDAPKTDASSES